MSEPKAIKSDEPENVIVPPVVNEVPIVMSTIDIAASLHAIGYRNDIHKSALKAFCDSTGHPSSGPMEVLIESLKAYGYSIKGVR